MVDWKHFSSWGWCGVCANQSCWGQKLASVELDKLIEHRPHQNDKLPHLLACQVSCQGHWARSELAEDLEGDHFEPVCPQTASVAHGRLGREAAQRQEQCGLLEQGGTFG